MKILYYIGYPLAWAKGGHAVMVNETIKEIGALGVETAWLHHEDTEPPEADILHYFARPPSDLHWQLARQQGMKIIVDEFHQTGLLRPQWMWYLRGAVARIFPHLVGRGIYSTMGIDVYHHLDATIAVTPAEADYIRIVMGTPADRIHLVPGGVDDLFFDTSITPEPFDGLLYVANITSRKNVLEVARESKKARIPVKFLSMPHATENDYMRAFAREVDNQYVFWDSTVTDRRRLAAIYRGALGTFLASRNEGLPLSLLESMATGTPIMVPDLANLRAHFKDAVPYIPPPGHPGFARTLRQFHDACQSGMRQPNSALRWREVAALLVSVYRRVLSPQ